MNAIIMAGCLGLILRVPTLPDPVDVIEINHVLDANGEETLCQLIFWSLGPNGFMEIVAWRLHQNHNHDPRKDFRTGRYIVRMVDKGDVRVITGKAIVETWTQYDPELSDRQRWAPPMNRLGLSKAFP
jgi:hypothetical protein